MEWPFNWQQQKEKKKGDIQVKKSIKWKILKQTEHLKGNPLFPEGIFFPNGNSRFQPISIFFKPIL